MMEEKERDELKQKHFMSTECQFENFFQVFVQDAG